MLKSQINLDSSSVVSKLYCVTTLSLIYEVERGKEHQVQNAMRVKIK